MPCTPNRKSPVALQEAQNPKVIANQFNNYFCGVELNLADSIFCTTGKQPNNFLEKKISDFVNLEPLTNNEIFNQSTSLKNKAVGHDNIQPFFIKVARFDIAHILNSACRTTSQIPQKTQCNLQKSIHISK